MSACQVCEAKTDGFVCARCGSRLEKVLAEMPALIDDLEITATKQDRINPGGKRGKGDEAPLPFNWSASDHLWSIWNTCGAWARHLAESRGCASPTRAALFVWLVESVQAIRMDEAGGQIYDEVTYAHDQAQRMIDRPEPEVYAGRCDAADVRVAFDDGRMVTSVSSCGADLYARLVDKAVKCRACGAEYDLAARKKDLLGRVDDEWARPHVIANALTSLDEPVTPETLRKWIERGHITQVSIDDDGKPLYRVGDVVARVALMRERRDERTAS